jgi:hypothetical protein
VYAGRIAYGGALPTSLGAYLPDTNLAGVSPAGYGPYLGNLFDDIAKAAAKVGVVSHELSTVASGQSNIATVPKDQAVLVLPVGGGVSKAVPLLPLALGAAALLFLGLRRRR